MSRSLFLNAQRTERVQGPITWRPQTDHQKSKVSRAWGQHWRLPVRSALWAAAFFLGCLQGFPESFLFTPEDSLPKSSTFLALLWLLLPLASYFSSLFSAASVFLPLNSLGLLSFWHLHGDFYNFQRSCSPRCSLLSEGRTDCLMSSVTFRVWICPESSLPEALGNIFRFAAVLEDKGCQISQ